MRREGNNIFLTLDEWQAAGLSYKTYENDRQRGYLQTANRACNGRGVEIIWQSIVKECRKLAIKGKLGDLEKKLLQNEIKRYIREDAELKTFFTDYELPDGQTLGEKDYKTAIKYYNNAILLKAIGVMLQSIKSEHKSKGNNIG
ncbi:MAG: hypothetical protein LBJ63_05085, partial [Prevotellaceae bacterium]|nr:hypothetical protein [Prevotellaceae bacterium]